LTPVYKEGTMREGFRPKRRDIAAAGTVVALLVVAYVVVPHRLVQYGAWLVIFTIWMAWFVNAGVEYVYGED
jgi:lipopolysaccharide export LptBFGC system permease protein LptF